MRNHGLWIWEEDECLALRRAIAAYNASRQKADRLARSAIASEIGVSTSTINNYFLGTKALDIEVAQAVLKLTGIPVERFSQRLAEDLRLKHDPNQT
ncbi:MULTISPECIES: helix-turn-helix domain-containing protein [Pseudomonas fluorescens group]|jgi:transcriptional regulator with XRE-family HTH domain|uniref:Helix-turn-helix domain-containing protein n=2 Tax=Pseudomonas TaxID=286 RepID=A0A921NMM6_9PSED|nr:XRE family transcriptional regulator [Pseudomonas koreensis]KAA8698826.1 helix-turn-helix transcriptional regulator [Pseudomonas proteolytica]MBL7231649.1 helix-turn-helix transcriptional regulator [Pseudomonas sp.]MRU54299.1 helix-turn-helix transcriptional regulator [Pseudomonas gessardii]NMY32672.1 helix-turn-helix transcriptional regulator [Pseudomonas sp. WS 5412]HJH21626.1 helix-turn-helix domain-containing protein [Pseudomonas lactis]